MRITVPRINTVSYFYSSLPRLINCGRGLITWNFIDSERQVRVLKQGVGNSLYWYCALFINGVMSDCKNKWIFKYPEVFPNLFTTSFPFSFVFAFINIHRFKQRCKMMKNDDNKANYKTDFTQQGIKLSISDNNQFTKLLNVQKPNFSH